MSQHKANIYYYKGKVKAISLNLQGFNHISGDIFRDNEHEDVLIFGFSGSTLSVNAKSLFESMEDCAANGIYEKHEAYPTEIKVDKSGAILDLYLQHYTFKQ